MGMLPINRAERFRDSDARCFVYLRIFGALVELKKLFSKIVYQFFSSIWLSYCQLWDILKKKKLTNLILITVFWTILTQRLPGEPCNEVGSLSTVECLVGLETGTFPEDILTEWLLHKNFCLQCFVPFKRVFDECMIDYMNMHHIFSSLPKRMLKNPLT